MSTEDYTGDDPFMPSGTANSYFKDRQTDDANPQWINQGPGDYLSHLSDTEDTDSGALLASQDLPLVELQDPSSQPSTSEHISRYFDEKQWTSDWLVGQEIDENETADALQAFFNPEIVRQGHVMGDIFNGNAKFKHREQDSVLDVWDGKGSSQVGDSTDDDGYDLHIKLRRVMRLAEPNAADTSEIPTEEADRIYVTDLLMEAVVKKAQEQYEHAFVSSSAEVYGILAKSLAELRSVGYDTESLQEFVYAAKERSSDCTLRSRKHGGVRRCIVSMVPPSHWTPVDCKVYEPTAREKYQTVVSLRSMGQDSKIPSAWHDVEPPAPTFSSTQNLDAINPQEGFLWVEV